MKEKLKKSPIVIAFIVGFMVAFGLSRLGLINTDSSEAAKNAAGPVSEFMANNPTITIIIMVILTIALVVWAVHTVVLWIKAILKIRRMWKRMKRRDLIKKYGYLPGKI